MVNTERMMQCMKFRIFFPRNFTRAAEAMVILLHGNSERAAEATVILLHGNFERAAEAR